MAVVQFKVAGAAADPTAEERLLQVGPYSLLLRQSPGESGAARHLAEGPRIEWPQDDADNAAAAAAGAGPDLRNVGLVVWSSGFVLADFLLRRPPLGAWPGVHALDLGAGTGVCGLFLAAAGARVVLTDLPHITPLTRANAAANLGRGGAGGAAAAPLVADYEWGEPAAALAGRVAAAAAEAAGGGPHQQQQGGDGPDHEITYDLIVGADVLYEPRAHAALLASLTALSAPHTQVYLCYRRRGLGEEAFEAAAAAAGWAAQRAPPELLHPEFQGGEYALLALCQI
ncbi:MAG: hypothetical protein J3K34DRAFT_46260 [Monoraphidium minutum]|nr:MAG: hypothetical protein J3K34DRAFT_46260 [Monoraphidium minutum]